MISLLYLSLLMGCHGQSSPSSPPSGNVGQPTAPGSLPSGRVGPGDFARAYGTFVGRLRAYSHRIYGQVRKSLDRGQKSFIFWILERFS